jgi:hypothetical protein
MDPYIYIYIYIYMMLMLDVYYFEKHGDNRLKKILILFVIINVL